MADDIVTRLREAGRCLDGHICSKCDREVRDDMGCKCACHDYPWGDAADEIERLRAERDTERALADQLARALLDGSFRGNTHDRRDRMYGSGWEAVHDALDAYEEARRG